MSPFTGKPLRLAIVNDYEIVVAGIARMLADHRDRVVVVEQAHRRAVLSDVDIILCDMFAHIGGHGADPTDMLGRGAKVVVFTWAVPPDPGSRMADGVAGYLSKVCPRWNSSSPWRRSTAANRCAVPTSRTTRSGLGIGLDGRRDSPIVRPKYLR
jgi:DNA-binding NarL/FixJ family response regulator